VSALTRNDKLRRLLIALFVVACVAGLGVAVANTKRVDNRGEDIVDHGDPDRVVLSGDDDALGTVPPPPAERDDLGDIVEQRFPPRNTEQLQGVQVGIDLGALYTGVLIVNGTEVPENQLIRQRALNEVFFSPGTGNVVEEWAPGRNCVSAVVWEVTGTRTDGSRTIDWCFQVT
jgi:hypothetical protein